MIFGTNSLMGKNMKMLEMGLNASLLRREVIADNIANADTPNFKRGEVNFESQLRRAITSEQKPQVPTLMTDSRHISFNESIDYQTVHPKISREYDVSYRNDKNGVDVEKEMVDSTKNSMRYNSLLEIYSRNIKMIDMVIR